MKVDIVVNNHNYERYLGVAIDSALAQTHPATRVIVVDDGSTDGSREMIAGYGDRITAVLKRNGGQASAVNAGVAAGCGEVVIILDADDALDPDAAERIAAGFAADSTQVRAHFRLRVMDADGVPTDELKPLARLPLAAGDLRRATLSCPFDAAWVPTSGNAYRRRALERVLPVPEDDYPMGADWYLVHVSSLLGPVGAIDAPLGRYRVHDANAFTRSDSRLDVPHVADTARYAEITRQHLVTVARREGLAPHADAEHMASMCDIANRAVLLRLAGRAPRRDSRAELLRLGLRSVRVRRDVGAVFKTAFLAWLLAMLVAPRSLARRLGELFVIPDRRPAINGLLARMHRL